MRKILVAGCGYVGGRLAELLEADGHRVWGLRRNPEGLSEGVTPLAADVEDPASLAGLPSGLDALVYAVSPANRSEDAYRVAYLDGYRNVLSAVERGSPGLRRTILVSSTGVYGYTDGRWVDEETPPRPAGATANVLLEAESRALDGDPRALVVRLGGIYGPGRTRMILRVLSGEAGCPAPHRYGNRIHRDDAAGALAHLLGLEATRALYLGVDREPAALRDVYRWIAERGGVDDPCAARVVESWEAEGRRGASKRCRSGRLVGAGYVFRHPTWREGCGPLVDDLLARGAVAEGREA